jgi:glycosyltransferase involved in cell wall biosynthesis
MSQTDPSISVVLPTYKREVHMVDTMRLLVGQLGSEDEIVVVDQTPRHEPATDAALRELVSKGCVRLYRKTIPSQAEAMNVAALVARGTVLLFLDDDIIPLPGLLEAHRAAFAGHDPPPATCGQVLQPWNEVPLERVKNFDLDFDAAYGQPCSIIALMAGNFAIPRETFISVGGMDENYRGYNYRNDSELAYRIYERTGKRLTFLPDASIRHLLAAGGNRAFGAKDSWGNIGSSTGDYYFALRRLPAARAARHCLHRMLKEPVNRHTLRHPWLIPSLYAREAVAFGRAVARFITRPHNYIRPLTAYGDVTGPTMPSDR